MAKSVLKTILRIRKRDGRVVSFEQEKISLAIRRVFQAVGQGKNGRVPKLSEQVFLELENGFAGKTPSVEDVQDVVERVLIKNGFDKAAKAYILYRRKRSEIRDAKKFFGVADDLKLTVNAVSVLEKRYLQKDGEGHVVETPSQMFRRVAKAVAAAETSYVTKGEGKGIEEEFYQMMANLEFLPNSPTMMNAGTKMGQLSACFVLPVVDSISGIFDSVKHMAEIHRSGGGTGFAFSHLRPKGDMVNSTQGVASGPVSFMRVFDTATDVVKQGGRRRGANMGILRVDHPDIMEFITAKAQENFLSNFNISVAITDDFMKKIDKNEEYPLVNPRSGKIVKKLRAGDVFDLITTMAWTTGDPGVVFIDEINRYNPTPKLGTIESTNPCGEEPLLSYESCNLGSINLAKMIRNSDVDWTSLKTVVKRAVRFLDDVIDVNRYPLPQVAKVTKGNRKIGLGVMGFADLLIRLGIPYNSDEALRIGEKIMKFISEESIAASIELAKTRGKFPNFTGSIWDNRGYKEIRNATLTTIAPTGTISIIASCSSGIEPLFAISFVRNVLEGTKLLEVNPEFEDIARERGFFSEELMMEIARRGSVQNLKEVPNDLRQLFVTAHDISPEWHVRMQAIFQKPVENAVSKTVNLPFESTIEDVKKIYLSAYKLKCKGVTIYRYGSKKEQVLNLGSTVMGKESGATLEYVSAEPEYSGGCPDPTCNLY